MRLNNARKRKQAEEDGRESSVNDTNTTKNQEDNLQQFPNKPEQSTEIKQKYNNGDRTSNNRVELNVYPIVHYRGNK